MDTPKTGDLIRILLESDDDGTSYFGLYKVLQYDEHRDMIWMQLLKTEVERTDGQEEDPPI